MSVNPKNALMRLHARVGDLWWYSAMLFLAARSGDAIQAFIGLWLVPKYVGPQELGAVLPLQQLSGFFTVPLAVVAVVFAKYVNVYATRGDFGKVKGFIRDVVGASAALFLVCIVAAHLLVPHFYSRLRVTAGSLTLLILAAGFACNLAVLLGNAMQGLKMFREMTLISFLGAPIRLVTLLVAMPIRALSGYFAGQTTPAVAGGVLSLLALRRRLAAVPCDATWRKDLPEILRYTWPIAVYTAFNVVFGTLSATVYRQRLPEIESSAYYLLMRFAEVAGYAGQTLLIVLVPLASEAHEKGEEDVRGLVHALFGALGAAALLAVAFAFCAKPLFELTETWRPYAEYAWLLPWLTLVVGVSTATGAVISYEMACRRFGATLAFLVFGSVTTALLVCFTGYDFFRGVLPDAAVDWMASWRLARLSALTWYTLVPGAVFLAAILYFPFRKRHRALPPVHVQN